MKDGGTEKFVVWMTKGIFWCGFSLIILGAESVVGSRGSLSGIEGDASKVPLSRSKILSLKDKDSSKGNFRFSDLSASESEEEPSPSSKSRKKSFGKLWEKYKPWRHKTKTVNRSQTYSTSGSESGYEEGQDTESPHSLTEVSFDFTEEEGTKSPMTAPLKKELEILVETPAASKRLSKKREDLISPLTLQIFEQGDAERALKKILEQKADEYDAKGESSTREMKEFEEIVDQFILENPVLGFMTSEDRKGFIKGNAWSRSGTSPLKPTGRKAFL